MRSVRLVASVVICAFIASAAPLAAPHPSGRSSVAQRSSRQQSLAAAAAHARDRGDLRQAEDLYRKGLQSRPDWPEGNWALGTILYDSDRCAEAREPLARFVKAMPKAGPGWALLGLCEYQSGRLDPAREYLKRAVVLGVGENEQMSRVARFHLLMLLTKNAEFELAWPWLTQLAREGVDNPELIDAAGLLCLRRAMLPKEVEPSDRELVARAGRAWWLIAKRDVVEGEKHFHELLARYPATPNLNFSYASFQTVQKPENAMGYFERELEIQPRHVPSLVALAFECLHRKDAAKAVEYGRRAADAGPDDFAAHAALGRALMELGEADQGAASLERARDLAPDSPQVRFALAAAYRKSGRREDARREQEEFLRLKRLAEAAPH